MLDLRTSYLRTGRDDEMARRIKRLLARDPDGNVRPATMGPNGETRGLVVTGPAGEGKTTLLQRSLSNHEGLQTNGDDLPVLHVDVPSPATTKSLAIEIVRESGYPVVSDRKEGWFLWELARRRLQLRGVRVLWLDEAHDLFRSGNQANVLAVTNIVKTLMKKETGVSIVLSGLEILEALVRKDDQLARRMSFHRLRPLDPDVDVEAVEDVLRSKAEDAGLALDLSRDLVGRLLASCDGRFGIMVETVTEACELAQDEGLGTLDVSVFADALADRLDVLPPANHFLAHDWRVLHSRFAEQEEKTPERRGRK